MASGYGYNGGTSRCFTFWREFQACYVQADTPGDCVNQKEDYLECLHHGKEMQRAEKLRQHYVAQEHKKAKEQREKGELRATGGILSLGLIGGGADQQDSSSGAEKKKES
ncbi:unnamed protein product [Sympodiomycopsis kandeliae]